ncbi:hypothetical protein AAF712_012766 [Marasmius tenuissimus]|uniref:F-box domain-containing protein n=1 Tax=Marasmius tenuissimus TaxID=585030 RepID=A0ABR2ZHJ1_9AGAR
MTVEALASDHPVILSQLRSLDPLFIPNIPPEVALPYEDTRVEIADYIDLIRNLEDRILALKAKKEKAERRISTVASLFSPIRRLPSEVLQEIFIFASVVEYGNMFGVASTWESRTLRISTVCYRWRSIALDTPEIWTRFGVELTQRALNPVQLFLDRSKSRPLSLTMIQTTTVDGATLDESVLGLLVSQSHRWQFVDSFDLFDYPDINRLEREIISLPSIRNFVCWPVDLSQTGRIVLEEQLKKSPTLECLTVRYDHYDHLPIRSFPVGKFIKELVFEYGPEGSFANSLDILRTHASTVESIFYASVPIHTTRDSVGSADQGSLPWHDDYIECPKVSELETYLYSKKGIYPHLTDIFASLTLPALEGIYLNGDSNKDEDIIGVWPVVVFRDFIKRSGQCLKLTEIIFDGLPLLDSDVVAALHETPQLEYLTVKEIFTAEYTIPKESSDGDVKTVTKFLISELRLGDIVEAEVTEPGAQPVPIFLPKLKYLDLRVRGHFDADREYVEMIRSRWYPANSSSTFLHVSLRTATLYILGREASESVYHSLKTCESQGMKVVVNAEGKVVV